MDLESDTASKEFSKTPPSGAGRESLSTIYPFGWATNLPPPSLSFSTKALKIHLLK